ncbi:MAG: shikimate kinase [Myxococcota bacterium]|nr:shikimate kinase [Myxococcota bacterium]
MNAAEPEAERSRLALIGGRGCGKSSAAARLVARHPALRVFDLDALSVEEAGGRPVAQIVEERGWRAWRDAEYRVLARVPASEGAAVVDCGGGIVVDLDDEDREIFSERKADILRGSCHVVYLHCASDLLWQRIAEDPGRPPLSADESFHALMERRDPWYRHAAHRVMEADALSSEQIAGQLAALFPFLEG